MTPQGKFSSTSASAFISRDRSHIFKATWTSWEQRRTVVVIPLLIHAVAVV